MRIVWIRGGTIKKIIVCYDFRACRPAVRAALVFGTNCLPADVPLRFAFVVAAYSAADNDWMAFLGR